MKCQEQPLANSRQKKQVPDLHSRAHASVQKIAGAKSCDGKPATRTTGTSHCTRRTLILQLFTQMKPSSLPSFSCP